MDKKQVDTLTDDELRAIARSTAPGGKYAHELNWAIIELRRRRLKDSIARLLGPVNCSAGGGL